MLTIQMVASGIPALTAWTFATVVGRATSIPGSGAVHVVIGPLAAYGAVLIVGHAMDALAAPLQYIVQVRIDGARRADVSWLVANCPTIERIESQQVRELIRLAKAEPENWTERTPGDGALAVLAMVVSVVTVVASSLVLLRYRWWLIPIVIVPAIGTRVLQSRHGIEFMRQWRRGAGEGLRAAVWSRMLTGTAEGKEVRVFGFAKVAAERVRRHMLNMFEPVWAVAIRNLREQWIRLLCVGVGLGATFAVVARSAAEGHIPVAVETAVFVAAWGICQAIAGYEARAMVGAIPGERAYAALVDLLNSGSQAGAFDDYADSTRPPWVRFEDVTFRYPESDRRVLDGLNLEIRPGELLAIVGMNGAGKSTLIKLLSGLYQPTAGRITAEGRDVWAVRIDRWRRSIAVVFQEFAQYNLSLADNILLGRPDARRDERDFSAAIERSGLTDVVGRLPHGADTLLGRGRTGGVELSGGQWQQVVLARALYAVAGGARLLVLDEPTAHLDVRSEFELFDRVRQKRGDLSIVLISHRLSTVRRADRIVLLDAGRIAEEGTHDELLALGGSYARMFDIQAARFRVGDDDRLEEGASL
jgi:ABC-type multidrug transport system fused ATPase/permease subunit